MGTEYVRGYCPNCQENVLGVRKGTNHVLHLLLSIITFGIWIIIWILVSIKIGGWRCSVCGGILPLFPNLRSNKDQKVPPVANDIVKAPSSLQEKDEFGRYVIK